MTRGGAELARYRYDAFNRKIETVSGGETRETVWSGWQPIETRGSGGFSTRRTYGVGLDEIVRQEVDVDGDGTAETVHAPVYDSTGSLVAILDEAGKPIERYEHSPYGERTIRADLGEPEIEQLRVVEGEVWIEVTERVSELRIRSLVATGEIRLENRTTETTVPIAAVTQPVLSGLQAGRRYVFALDGAPAPGDAVRLVLPAGALADSFLNTNGPGIAWEWTWSGAGEVIVDTSAPQVAEVRLRAGRVEIEWTEEVDPQSAHTKVTIDGAQTGWELLEDRYTLRSILGVSPLAHTVAITPGISDLSGKSSLLPLTVAFPAGAADRLGYRRADPTEIPTSSAANLYGFHGHELDPATGLVYARNRWYDPQMGRFVSPDPLGYVDGPSAYAFAGNDPANVSDPLGLWGQGEASSKEKLAQQRSLQEARAQREAKCRADRFSVHCMSDFELNVAGHLGDESFSQPMLLEPTGSGDNPIISVNGIRNDQLLATDLAREVSKISGRDVQPVYNPTRNPVFDLAQTALVNKPDIPDSTTQLVARTISEQLTRLPASQNLTVVGHSQGAAIDAAAFTRLTPAERGRIDFVSIGGAACHAPADLNSRTFIINTRDFVPMVAGAGFAPCRGVMEAEGSVSYKYYSFGDLSPKTSHGAQSYRIAIQTQEPSNSALESEARALLRSAAIGMMKLDPAGQRMKAAVMMMP